jgi:hypothetical protein
MSDCAPPNCFPPDTITIFAYGIGEESFASVILPFRVPCAFVMKIELIKRKAKNVIFVFIIIDLVSEYFIFNLLKSRK